MTPPGAAESTVSRPRVEGDRETEVLEATMQVLVEVGYDRLTMDAVALKARASKATLYRRWSSKLRLVLDALQSTKPAPAVPDTGTLRGDLLEMMCAAGGMTDDEAIGSFGAVLTAVVRDPEFAAAFREEFIGPKVAVSRTIWERARARGEVRGDLDLELFEPALAGICLHRVLLMGEQPTEDLIARVIDQIILPAAMPTPAPDSSTGSSNKEKQ
jgi:AcrR family transcriptional regulator